MMIASDLNKHIGSVIRRKRKKKNISQEELATAVRVTKSTISRYEHGKIDIPLSQLTKISQKCEFPVRDYVSSVDSEDAIDGLLRFDLDDPGEKLLSDEYKKYLYNPKNAKKLERVCKGYEVDLYINECADYSLDPKLQNILVERVIKDIHDTALSKRLRAYYEEYFKAKHKEPLR